MQTIVMKELRENIRLLPVGLLLVSACLFSVTPTHFNLASYFGSMSAELMAMSSIGAGFFAILLGAAQSWFDLSQRQRGFLFHRPFSRNQILYGKVIAAAILYSIACLVPIGCVALWFASNGPLYLPVRPTQLLPATIMCMLCFVLHPVTIFTIERDARWIGTRLFPLLGTASVLFIFFQFTLSFRQAWYPIAVVAVLAFVALASATLIAKHSSRKWIIGLGAFVFVVVSVSITAGCLESLLRGPNIQVYPKTTMDESGKLWSYRYESVSQSNGYVVTQVPVSGEPLAANRKPDLDRPVPKDFKPRDLTFLAGIPTQWRRDPFINAPRGGGDILYSDSRGSYLVYDLTQNPPFKGTVTRNGFNRSGELVSKLFSCEPAMLTFPSSHVSGSHVSDSLIADSNGIYHFNQQAATVETLVEMPIQRAAILLDSQESGYFILAQSEGKLHLFALDDESGASDWFQTMGGVSVPNSDIMTYHLPKLTARNVHTYPAMPAELADNQPGVGLTKSGELVVAADARYRSYFGSITNEADAEWQVSPYISAFKFPQQPLAATCTIALIPSVLFVFAFVVTGIAELANGRSLAGVVPQLAMPVGESLTLFIFVAVVATAVSVGMTIYVSRRRGLTLSATIVWAVATVLLGLAGPLTIIAIYPRIAFETCTRCNRARRVDNAKCKHCSSEWEALPAEGIEIVDRSPGLVRA